MSTAPLSASARIDDVVALSGHPVERPAVRLDGAGRVPAAVCVWERTPALVTGLPPDRIHRAFRLHLFFEYARLDPARRARAWRHAGTPDEVIMVMDVLPGVHLSTFLRALEARRGQIPLEIGLAVWAEVIALVLPHLALLDRMHMSSLRCWGAPSLWTLLRLGFDGRVGLQPTRWQSHDPFLETSAGARCAPDVRALHNLGLVGWFLLCGDGPRPLAAHGLAAALDLQQTPRRPAMVLRPDLPPAIAAALDGLVDPEGCVEAGATVLATVRRALSDCGGAPDPGDGHPAHRAFMTALLADLFPDLAREQRAHWDDAFLVHVDSAPVVALGEPLEVLERRALLFVDDQVRRSLLTQT